ncbi:MAG: hypothetical protein DCE86_03010 [Flavobacteriaceae bacterium]|nr:MAG: hypothetical protein DCE86_03010 [Flavobacteriaceae bacterium]PZQ85891.1 MAG: hypothetical protein DI548_08105 [Flavobacterium johnsoniae]
MIIAFFIKMAKSYFAFMPNIRKRINRNKNQDTVHINLQIQKSRFDRYSFYVIQQRLTSFQKK